MARTGKFAKLKKKGKKGKETTDDVKVDSVKTEASKKQAVKTESKKPELQAATPKIGQGVAEKADLGGLIFMCNRSTKDDCFKYRVFGLPEAKKSVVEQVRRNTRLFLFDVDLRVLYGIYKASSRGGFNLQADAFRGASKAFPWQVRFTVLKDCLPLPENVFKKAIKENYDSSKKFKIELSFEQVQKLMKLFRPVPMDAGVGGLPQRAAPLVRLDVPPRINYEPPPRINYEPKYPAQDLRPPPRANFEPSFADDLQLAREIRMRRELGAPEYIPAPASHSVYGADSIYSEIELRKTDPYLLGVKDDYSAYPQIHSLGNPPVEVGSLYRQRSQQVPDIRGDVLDRRAYGLDVPLVDGSSYGGISGEILRKRALDDTYLDDRGLVARNLDLQRRLPYEETATIPGPGRFSGISPLGRHYVGSGR